MATRRGAGGRSEDRDEHAARKVPHKESARAAANRGPPLDEFWLDGADIDRQVLQSSICRFLGPEATCRPFDHEGKPGYKIRAVRPFTPQMLEDLKERSQEFVKEARANKGRNELKYEDSQTRRRGDAPDEMDFEPTPMSQQRGGTYSSPSNPTGYPAQYVSETSMPHSSSMYQPSSYAYTQSQYVPQPGFAGPSGYNDTRTGYAPEYSYPTSREGPPIGSYGYAQPTAGGFADSSRRPEAGLSYNYPPEMQPRIYNEQPQFGYDPSRGGHPNPQGIYGQPPPSRGPQPGQPPYEPPRDYGRTTQDPYASHQQQRGRR